MRPFHYIGVHDLRAAVTAASVPSTDDAPAQFIAGGTTILDLMKLDVMQPAALVDLNALAAQYGRIEAGPNGLRLGALVTMSQAASDPAVKRDYPIIAESLNQAASGQIRNMASLGGNVLQRSRCSYFRDPAWQHCNKRLPGSGCAAIGGMNRKHAVLGVSEKCISTYPGDFAQALVALGASVQLAGRSGVRVLPFEQLHHGAQTPERETLLEPGEVITGFFVPAGAWTRRSTYVKVRDRQSYEFAVASAAVALDLDGTTVREVRIALGGVAYRPWRAHEAEAVLKGRPLDDDAAREAARIAFAGAKPREHNGYKIELGKRTLVRALRHAAAMPA